MDTKHEEYYVEHESVFSALKAAALEYIAEIKRLQAEAKTNRIAQAEEAERKARTK